MPAFGKPRLHPAIFESALEPAGHFTSNLKPQELYCCTQPANKDIDDQLEGPAVTRVPQKPIS